MVRSLTRRAIRKTVVLAVIVLAGLSATLAASAPAHAASVGDAGSSVASTAGPQDEGVNGWVNLIAYNGGNGLDVVTANLIQPGDILFSDGHWEILTPLEHYNTPDGTYQKFFGLFRHAAGKYCAIWWYRDALGNYTDEGFPCVNVG